MPAKVPASTRAQVSPVASRPKKRFSLISDEKLRDLYAGMLKCRMLQERALELSKRTRRSNHRPTAIGHEAAAVGIAIDLLPEDVVAAAHGDLLSGFLKGAPLSSVFHALVAPSGNGHGQSRNGHVPSNGHAPLPLIPPAPTAESQLGVANGAAFATKVRHNGSIAIAFAGDLSAPSALWHTTLSFAATHKLPIIYVVQSDPSLDLSQTAIDCGLPGIPVDGSDVVAVYRVAYETITRIRQGNGPALIECRQPDTSLANGARHTRDPLRNMENYLAGKDLFTEAWKQQLIRSFARELDTAVKKAGTTRQKKK